MSSIFFFKEKQVRRAWNATDKKWVFSIDDIDQALTGSINLKDCIKKLRKRDPELVSYWGTNCPPVETQMASHPCALIQPRENSLPKSIIANPRSSIHFLHDPFPERPLAPGKISPSSTLSTIVNLRT